MLGGLLRWHPRGIRERHPMGNVLRMDGVFRIIAVRPLLESRAPGTDGPACMAYFPHEHVLTRLWQPQGCRDDFERCADNGARGRKGTVLAANLRAVSTSCSRRRA